MDIGVSFVETKGALTTYRKVPAPDGDYVWTLNRERERHAQVLLNDGTIISGMFAANVYAAPYINHDDGEHFSLFCPADCIVSVHYSEAP